MTCDQPRIVLTITVDYTLCIATASATHIVSRAGVVTHGILADGLVVAVVVETTVGRTPALPAILGSHKRGAHLRAVVLARL